MEEVGTKKLAPFLRKIYDLVDDPNTNDLISWNYTRQTFTNWNHLKFSSILLPQHFTHCNFSSLVYQLNNYGFRKLNNKPCEYYHEFFQPGRKDLLYNIKRRSVLEKEKQTNETESPWKRFHLLESECEILKEGREKLKNEVNELQQEHEDLEKQLANNNCEEEKEKVVILVMEALSNPSFFQQLRKNGTGDKIEESDEQVTKKQRLSEEIDNNHHGVDKRSEEEPKTKSWCRDSPDLNSRDFFAIEKIREFLLRGAATFQNASQSGLEGDSMEFLTKMSAV